PSNFTTFVSIWPLSRPSVIRPENSMTVTPGSHCRVVRLSTEIQDTRLADSGGAKLRATGNGGEARLVWHKIEAAMLLRALAALLVLSVPVFAAEFARDVQPVFQQRCIVCHGEKQHLSGL